MFEEALLIVKREKVAARKLRVVLYSETCFGDSFAMEDFQVFVHAVEDVN